MIWYIEDLNEHEIYITNMWSEYVLPKLAPLGLSVNEPYLNIQYVDANGVHRKISIDYLDVVSGYTGYVTGISSAQDLYDEFRAMIVSGFNSSGGSILTAKGDLLTHDGVSDLIHPAGLDRSLVGYWSANVDGLRDWTPVEVVASGLSRTNTESLEITLAGAVISGRVKKINLPPVSTSQWNPLDGTTVVFNNTGTLGQNAAANLRNTYPPAGILMGVHLDMTSYSTTGSNENISIYIRVNDTTDYLIATVGSTALVRIFENLAMNAGAGIAFNGTTDFYCYKVVCPTWATNPAASGFQGYTNYYIT